MKTWLVILVVLLAASIGLNVAFYQALQSLPYQQVKNSTSASSSPTAFNWGDSQSITPRQNNESKYNEQPEQHTSASASDIPFSVNHMSRSELLHQANKWLNQKHIPPLITLLQEYLKQHPQDMDFLLIEAQMKVETSLLSDAIANYYNLLRHPMTSLQQSQIEEQITTLSSNTIKQLQSTYSWDLLAEFVEPLLQLDPDNREYILSLARAYAEQYQSTLMENILAALPYDDPSASAIRRIVARQQLQQEQIEEGQEPNLADANLGRPIALKQIDDQFVVSAALSGNHIDLLIDTGASITVVSKQFYNRLSNQYKGDYIGRFSVHTAGGTVRAPMYKFSELRIQHANVKDISIVVLPMRGLKTSQGLLGMNFLREFDFKIDQKTGTLFID